MKTLSQNTEPSNTEPINLAESKRLIELEKIIEAGQQVFIAVGTALAEIRDARLYKSDFKTFEEYCHKKWNFTRQYVNQIIAGTSAVKSLPTGMETIVSNQGQARALVKVPKEKRVEVLTKAKEKAKSEGRTITAKDISGAATEGLITEAGFRKFLRQNGFTVEGISCEDFERVFHDFLRSKGIIFTSTDADLIVKLFIQGRLLLFSESFAPEAIQKLLVDLNPSKQLAAAA